MTDNIETIPVDVPEDTLCILLESHLKDTLTAASFSIFAEQASEIGMDLEALKQAAGEAIVNEALVKVIERFVNEENNAHI